MTEPLPAEEVDWNNEPLKEEDPAQDMEHKGSSTLSLQSTQSDPPNNPRWRHTMPSQPSMCDRIWYPYGQFAAWIRLLCDNFGAPFVVMVIFGEHLLKGLLGGGGSGGFLVIEGIAYLKLQVGASTKSVLQAVSSSAWSLKPMYGLISDTLTIHGYRRTPWIVVTAVLACAGYLTIFHFGQGLPASMACVCFFAAKMQLSWTDLMVEATYSEKIHTTPRFASDIITWVWSGIGFCSILGVLVAGPGLDLFGPFTTATIAIPIAGAIIVPACLGWLQEKPIANAPCLAVQTGLVVSHWNMFLCTLVLTLAVVVSGACGIARLSTQAQALMAAACSVSIGIAAVLLLPSTITKPMLFMFMASALSINMYGFVDNFYLDAATPEESAETGYPVCEDCPHFSSTFYITVVGICDAVFMTLASWVFNAVMSQWTYRKALVVTQAISTVASLVDIIQFERLNKHMGIPDSVFMLGKAAVQNTCGMLNFMPTTILISKLCPRGVESTVFALLAGFSNFGGSISGYLGAYILDWIGMGDIGQGKVDDFSNAWKACVINSCAPLVVLIAIPFLIPNCRMSDAINLPNLDESTSEPATPREEASGRSQNGVVQGGTEMYAIVPNKRYTAIPSTETAESEA